MANLPVKTGGRYFRHRNGLDGFFWKGMSTRTDLGAQAPDRPRLVVNGRFFGGHIVARPPISGTPVAAVPPRTGIGVSGSWHPAFLGEHHSYAGIRLWFGQIPYNLTGGQVCYVDTDWDQEYKEVTNYYHAFSFAPVIERFANFIYIGDHEALRRIYRVEVPPGGGGQGGQYQEYDYLTPADEIVAAYPGFTTTALYYHEGKLFFALADLTSTVNGYIYSWDGYQATLEQALTVPGASGVSMKSFRNTLVVTVRGLGSILVRDATGAWTTETVGGFDSSAYMNSMTEVHDKLYIMGGDDKIYSWDGTTLALARTITGGTSPSQANCCTVFNGRLYYVWAETVDTGKHWPWLGVFDPDTTDAVYKWKDDYKSFGFSDGNVLLVDSHSTGSNHPYISVCTPSAMTVYRQRLVVAINHTAAGAPAPTTELTTHSVENNPYSAWHIIHANPFVQPPTGPMYIPNFGTRGSILYMKVL